MSRMTDIRDALVSTLQSITGGSYTLDLSSTTYIGQPPLSLASGTTAYVWRGSARWPRGNGAPVGAREVVASWNVVIYGGAASTPEAREEWIDAAEADLLAALDVSLSSGGDLFDLSVEDLDEIEVTPLYGSQPNAGDPVGIWAVFKSYDIDGVI